MSILNIPTLKRLNCELWFRGESVSANAPKTITSVGDVKQILPFPGAGIGMFDGNGDYLAIPDSDDWYFGTSDFTIELWYCPTILPTSTNGSLFEIRTTEYISPLVIMHDNYSSNVNKYAVMFSWDWTADRAMKSTTLASVGRWDHVALVRQGSTFKLYVNGIAESTYNSSNSIGNSGDPLYIGGVPFRATASINGMLCDYRISKNIARYTANFTPPRRQLESDEHTKLLLHFNRNDTTFVDSSPSAHTITAYGDAKQLCSPVGSGVACFDGNGDYLSCGAAADWSFLAGATWTVEMWFYSSGANRYSLFDQSNSVYSTINIFSRNSSTYGMEYWFSVGGGWYSITSVYGNLTYVPNAWNHVTIVRSGNSSSDTIKCYLNGNLDFSINIGTTPLETPTNPTTIGRYSYSGAAYINGYLSEIRISNVARYTANFIPQTTPFKPDPYTKLLLHMDGVGNAFYDSSDPPGDNGFAILPDGVTVTPAGTFAVQKLKNGQNSLKFNGSTNYIAITDHASWDFAANEEFTISFWAKYITGPPHPTIVCTCPGTAASAGWMTSIGYELRFSFNSTTGGGSWNIANVSSILSWVSGQWYYFTIIRKDGVITLYRDLTITTSGACTSAISSSNTLTIGYDGAQASAFANNNIKDLMIFKKALTVDQIGAIMDETYIF